MIARINALDTLFFRDGKPFSLGEDNWADAIFPPSPSVIYGALRTLYLSNTIGFNHKVSTLNQVTDNLSISGIYIEVNGKLHLPVPQDFVVDKSDDSKKYILELVNDNTKNSNGRNHNLKHRFVAPSLVENTERNALFSKIFFQSYLNYASSSPVNYYYRFDYIKSEPKIGIGRDKTSLTSSEGKLYRVDMLRLGSENLAEQLDINFLIDFEFEGEEAHFTDKPFIKLGGEGKTAAFYRDDTIDTKIPLPTFAENERIFKVCFATPAIFKKGWLPEWIDETNYQGKFQGKYKLELLAATMDKPISIGGFDMKSGPKPMLKAIPIGSVYYFKIVDDSISNQEVFNAFHQKCVSDEMAKQGFGLCFVGKPNIKLN